MKAIARTLLAGFLACPVASISQQIPLFQFKMYFEDNVGNRDSITLGHDPVALSDGIDAQFGEIEITAPMDSIFEVRAIHFNDTDEKLLKTVIVESVDSTLSCLGNGYGGAIILFNSKYPPVTISYDSTHFPLGTCGNVILSPAWNMFFLQQWWDACDYHCMAGASSYIEDFIARPLPNNCWNRLFIEKEVEGQGLKMLPGLFFTTFYGPGPCNDTTFLSSPDISPPGFGALQPNPAGDFCSVQVPEGATIQAQGWDISGRPVACPHATVNGAIQFEMAHLPPGLYFLRLQMQGENGRSAVYRVVKM
jgi:hypothetical protein